MLPKGTFSGKTAVVTGGGTGLGRGMAIGLSQLGANVAIIGRRLGVLEQTAKEITKISGNPVLPVSTDVRDPTAVNEAINKVEREFGLPQLVINNAAGNFISPTERVSPKGWKTIIDIVLNGTAFVTLDIGKRLIAAEKGGAFISITTTYTVRGSGFVVPSAAAKAGVENMSRSLASEWGRYGIRLNCISPGPIETEGAFSRLDPTGSFAAEMINRNPCGRLGEVEEISNLASFLLSDYASWMTGETVTLDGGELPFMAGEFNNLSRLSKETWDQMEEMIRKGNLKDKSK